MKMQSFAVAFAVLACVVALSSAAPAPNERISVAGALHDMIEQFRRQMACGINGGPPLAPLEVDRISLDFDESPNIV